MRGRADGFTLLEALVAFAILSLTLLSLFRAFDSGLLQERRAAAASARIIEARSLLEEVGVARPIASGEGRLSSGEVRRLQTALIESDRLAASPLRAYRLDLVVSDGRRTVLTLSTVKLAR